MKNPNEFNVFKSEVLNFAIDEALENKFEATTIPGMNVTVYAKWNKLPVYSAINYKLDGGVNPSEAPATYEEGVGVTLPTPTKEGYEFLGWVVSLESSTITNAFLYKSSLMISTSPIKLTFGLTSPTAYTFLYGNVA